MTDTRTRLIARTSGILEILHGRVDFDVLKQRANIEYAEVVRLSGDLLMLVDEDGFNRGLPINPFATAIVRAHGRAHVIVGDVAIVPASDLD